MIKINSILHFDDSRIIIDIAGRPRPRGARHSDGTGER